MIDFHIIKLTTEFIVQWISKTRRFNPRLGQKSNPIHLKNWKIIMQSKLGTIGSSVQPSKLQPGLRTVFSTLYSQPVQPSKLRIIPFQPVLNSFLHLFSLCSLLSTCNHCSRTNYHKSCRKYISNPWRLLILLHISNMKIPIPSIPMKLFIISKTLLFSFVRM